MPAEYVDLPIYHEELARALGFKAADLEDNRAGRLSASERAYWLRHHVYRDLGRASVFLVLAGTSVAIGLAIGFAIGFRSRPAWGALLVAAILLFGAGYLAWVALTVWQDLSRGAVSSIEGLVQPGVNVTNVKTASTLPAMPIWTFYWTVGDQRFWVSGKAYGVLTPARHRLYFLPRTRRIVAAEPISTGT